MHTYTSIPTEAIQNRLFVLGRQYTIHQDEAMLCLQANDRGETYHAAVKQTVVMSIRARRLEGILLRRGVHSQSFIDGVYSF